MNKPIDVYCYENDPKNVLFVRGSHFEVLNGGYHLKVGGNGELVIPGKNIPVRLVARVPASISDWGKMEDWYSKMILEPNFVFPPTPWFLFHRAKDLKLDWLKANCQMVHYFGLGFIQLKLDTEHRLHFYTEKLPAIVSEEEVHNHRYDFYSRILKGEFEQELFRINLEETGYVKEYESCQETGNNALPPAVNCCVGLTSSHSYGVGSQYFIQHDVFHRVKAKECITFLKRGPYRKEYAEVVRIKGSPKMCPFSQKVEEKTLWEIIEAMITEG